MAVTRNSLRLLVAAIIAICTLDVGASVGEPPKTVLVFVDLSDSTKTHRDDYRRYFGMVLDRLGDGDKLIVASIEKAPTGRSIVRMKVELKVRDPLFDTATAGIKSRKQLYCAQQDFQKLVETQSSETPIVDSLLEAHRLFANVTNPRHVVVLLSDMKESWKGGPNFEAKNFAMPEKKTNELLAKLRNQQRIADLTDARIYVAGARDDRPVVQKEIGGFWAAYFHEAKADFDVDRYGPELLSFEECASCDKKDRFSKVNGYQPTPVPACK